MEQSYLIQFCKDDITELMNAKREQYHSITVSLTTLKRNNLILYNEITTNLSESLNKWNKALLQSQYDLIETGSALLDENYSIKQLCFVHFNKLPEEDDILIGKFPTIQHHNQLIQLSGKIVRRSKVYNYQKKRKYVCNKCKDTKIIESTYEENYNFNTQIMKCKNLANNCRGTLQPDLINFPPEFFIKYQECRIQEASCSDIKKSIPKSVRVSLANDLVDTCDPGEFVSICGVYELQWRPFIDNKKIECKFYLNAIGIIKDENKIILQKNYRENIICASSQWHEDVEKYGQLNSRDLLINSICPEICNTYMVKLSLGLALSSCYRDFKNKEISKRAHSHLLLIGDPGVGKSRFLEAAAQLSLRSASTTGLGSTNAGLTAACIQENGSYHLEAGALVLADNGVCCIDEFNLLQENERTSIHEALEQQEINIAKAGILAKLNTRCVVVAAANPKCLASFQESDLNSSNIGIESPLLSRFDLVLIMKNDRNLELDRNIAVQKLNSIKNKSWWTTERLKSHFLAGNEIQPEVSEPAKHIILQYYLFCRQDPERDRARTTIRLQDSLNRLSQAHARLMLRKKVLGCDVILIIKVMEASYSFGRIFSNRITMNKLDEIGPTENEILEVLNKLHLLELKDDLLRELYDLKKMGAEIEFIEETQEEEQQKCIDFEAEFGFRKERLQINSGKHDECVENEDKFCVLSLMNSYSSDDISQAQTMSNGNEKVVVKNINFDEIQPIKNTNDNRECSPIPACSSDLKKSNKEGPQIRENINLMDFDLEDIQPVKKFNNNLLCSPKASCSKDWVKSSKKTKLIDLDLEATELLNSLSAIDNNKYSSKSEGFKDGNETNSLNESSSQIDELLLQMDNEDFEMNFEQMDAVISERDKIKKQPLSTNRILENSNDEFLLTLDFDNTEVNLKHDSGISKKRNFNIDDIENFEIESFLNTENTSTKKLKVIDNDSLNKKNGKTTLEKTNKNQIISRTLIDERNELKKELSRLNEIEASRGEWKTLYCTQQAKEKYLREKAKKQTEFLTNITDSELNELLDLESFSTVDKS